jgi:PAP_fibrillin
MIVQLLHFVVMLVLVLPIHSFLAASPAVQVISIHVVTAQERIRSFRSYALIPATVLYFSSIPSDVESQYMMDDDFDDDSNKYDSVTDDDSTMDTTTTITTPPQQRLRYQHELIQLGASYDRGFGATFSAREKVHAVIRQLEQLNMEQQAASTILFSERRRDRRLVTAPTTNYSATLIGNWRMIWTTALDVLSLQASPFFITGAIYQVFESHAETNMVTNIIDFIPRIQTLAPSIIPNTLIRAKVQTRACLPMSRRNGGGGGGIGKNQPVSTIDDEPNRVGLIFESVSIQPVQVFGWDSNTLPPMTLDLPKLPGVSTTSSPGYFDVTYLDDDFLIIRQNAPGGLFCFIRTKSIDP